MERGLGHSDITIAAVRDFRLGSSARAGSGACDAQVPPRRSKNGGPRRRKESRDRPGRLGAGVGGRDRGPRRGPVMRPTRIAARAAVVAGAAAAFVAAATLLDAIGPELLIDADPAWAILAAAPDPPPGRRGRRCRRRRRRAASTSRAARRRFDRTSSRRTCPAGPSPRRERPPSCWEPACGLPVSSRFRSLSGMTSCSCFRRPWRSRASPGDFRDTVRMVLDDGGRHSGTVGVLYLEAFRAALRTFGTTVFGVRFLSAFGGVLSLCTAMLLGRALLPRGGGTLAGLVLAGLRWSLILSRWGWNMIVLAPLLDVATLVALRARRRGRAGAAVSRRRSGRVWAPTSTSRPGSRRPRSGWCCSGRRIGHRVAGFSVHRLPPASPWRSCRSSSSTRADRGRTSSGRATTTCFWKCARRTRRFRSCARREPRCSRRGCCRIPAPASTSRGARAFPSCSRSCSRRPF